MPTRHPNNFFHKLCSTLIDAGLFPPVPLVYRSEKPKFLLGDKKTVFGVIFFNSQILYIATRHPNNFFHKLCLSDTLIDAGLFPPVPLVYTSKIVTASCTLQMYNH